MDLVYNSSPVSSYTHFFCNGGLKGTTILVPTGNFEVSKAECSLSGSIIHSFLVPHMPHNETSREEIDDRGYSIEVIYSQKRAMIPYTYLLVRWWWGVDATLGFIFLCHTDNKNSKG